jgi:tetratricopeptide (TPR) repeat protein
MAVNIFRKIGNKNGDSIPPDSQDDRLERAQLLLQGGGHAAAAAILEEVVTSQPQLAIGWYKLGNAQRLLNRADAALASYQRAVDLNPLYGAALCNRGVVLMAIGRPRDALASFERAINADPADHLASYNYALAQIGLDDRSGALESLNKAIALHPDYFDAYLSRAGLYAEDRDLNAALTDLDRACSLRPELSIAFLRRANTFAELRRWTEALRDYDKTLQLDPSDYIAHLHRGNVCREMGRFDEALRNFDQAIELDAARIEGHFNRGLVLEQLGRVPEALGSFERAIAIQPDWATAQHSRALALLLLGDFAQGFAAYEWRWKNRVTIDPQTYRGAIPLWDGVQNLQGKSILVFSEQGLGDTLQFSRYVNLVAAKGPRVIFEVQQPLLELMQRCKGADAVISPAESVPSLDFKCPLMSLPRLLGTTLDTIPAAAPYLTADPQRLRRWQVRLKDAKRPRIGLTWSGNPNHPEDRYRSVALSALIEALPREFDYFCLQREVRAADRAVLETNPGIRDIESDFPDTAALCECMDLVLSTCTSIAHLAGALGRPLWLLLPFNADWRWLLDRSDSPWYSTARLYRQSKLGDWTEPLKRIGQDIRIKFGTS